MFMSLKRLKSDRNKNTPGVYLDLFLIVNVKSATLEELSCSQDGP